MKAMFEAIAVAFSMYSTLPVPHVSWNQKNMRYAIAFLPAVGLVQGAALGGLFLLVRPTGAVPAFFAALAVLLPVLLTGGIHLDGFCDSCDALASHGDRTKKLAILKDPHIGAFGVIYLAALLLVQFGAWQQVYQSKDYLVLALAGGVFARTLAAAAVVVLKKASEQGLAAVFSASASAVLVLPLGLLAAAVFFVVWIFCGWAGVWALVSALGAAGLACRIAFKEFGGISGDVAGFGICIVETWLLAAAALLGAWA